MANHLVIGLGGTGGSVLRALRKRIYEEFRSNDPMGDAHIEYLYVDSSLADLNNEEDWQTLGTSVQLSPAQRLSINGIGSGVLSNLDQYPGINAFINRKDEEMLKEGIGAIISEGIGGQRRRFGRMLIANNMCGLPQNTFVGQIHSRVKALKEKEDIDDVTFHICAGLGGGTGSGSIVDAVTQIRNEFQRTGDDRTKFKIQLYLYVPEKIIQIPGGEDSNRYYQPNGYAALLELNAMSVGRYYPTDVKGNTDEYGNVRRLLKGQDAFDMAYLYTNVNEAGKEVNLHKVLPGIVGDFLFQKIVASSMQNGGKMARLESNENNGLLPEENEIKEPVHSRKFMTFGVKRIEYPETEVVEYGAYHFARQASIQMLYGLWDDARGYIECTEDMVGKSCVQDVDKEIETNLLTDDYLMLSKPLPSIEKHVTNWKPIIQGWEYYIDRYKQDVQAECQKKEWYEEFNKLCENFFGSMYRGKGVKKFYFDYESQIPGFAEEICRRIENNLFAKWKKGEISIIEVHKYINILIKKCNERIEEYKEKITKRSAYLNEDLADQLENIRIDWNNIGWLKDAITNASTKTFGRFADAKREQLTVTTTIYAYGYATKLLSEIANMLTLLNVNSVEPFIRVLNDFADIMKKQAEEKCKLSDAETGNINGEVVKEYDPRLVRDTVLGFLKNQDKQKKHADNLRANIIESAGTTNIGFNSLCKKINVGTLQEITLKLCIESARNEMDDYSMKNPNQRLVNVNILDKLRNTDCSTPDKRKRFVKEIYNAAQSFLPFNGSEEGKGSPETAANHQKIIQLSLPTYEEDDTFRNDFIKDFGESGKIPFNKDNDVSTNFKSNQIVVVTAHSGFPLRYVDNVRVLKEKYDILTRNEINRMVVHTESFSQALPTLFNKSNEEAQKDLMPVVLLAYTIDGIIVDREDVETGEKTKAFAGEKNKMGRISRWINVGNDMVVTLKELSKMTRAVDAATLKKIVIEELNTNYKHIEKKNQLMLKLGEVLDNQLLPLVGGNENNPVFIAFNTAAEKLCDNDLKIE
ncbi:Tubulin like protein [Bacteroides finegoldii]|uniref:Uncharacterized protein n=1 Tax=Bacteroides finegoldii CL09T03C10 TaxID=997888 RepID=K5C9H8_9BACE|nr:tubulin-like doman-containing protein [Bacteroides finegoldii]EKJ89404.1 hypothetical protein HMPREF1057_02945 [Bacteroides finegoldii CL09T03C10]